jgi:hypothetical protein
MEHREDTTTVGKKGDTIRTTHPTQAQFRVLRLHRVDRRFLEGFGEVNRAG